MRTGVPKRFSSLLPGDLEPSKTSEAVLDYIDMYNGNEGRGLLLFGPPGTGKTALACAALNEVVRRGLVEKAQFVTMANYIRRTLEVIRLDSFAPRDPDIYDEWKWNRDYLKALRNEVDLLVLDDVGKEHITGSKHAEDEIDFLLRTRYDLALPTIVTTNLEVKNWNRYSEAMESFIHEAYHLLPFGGNDRRRRKD